MQSYSPSSGTTMIDLVVMLKRTEVKREKNTAIFWPSIVVWQQIDPEHSIQW